MTHAERLRRQLRFGLGLAGLFVSTVVVTLAVLAVAATVVPRWHSTVVASGSMEPALRRGDTVIYVERTIDEVAIGEIVIFDGGHDVATIHRIVGIDEAGLLTTRGDANPSNDSAPVTADQLRGSGRIVVPWVGLLRLWWMDGRHALVIGIVVAIAFSLRVTRSATAPEADPWPAGSAPTPAVVALSEPLPVPPLGLLPTGGLTA